MKIIVAFLLLIGIVVSSCNVNNGVKSDSKKNNWPLKIDTLPIGLKVTHSPSVVYATFNKKDPEKKGRYQLKHVTTVSPIEEDLEIIEFGSYSRYNNEWVLTTIYGRPFNREEFIKWYECEDGILKVGTSYSDKDNWIGKTNKLTGKEIRGLWYFIGKNKKDKLFVGASEIIGILKMKSI